MGGASGSNTILLAAFGSLGAVLSFAAAAAVLSLLERGPSSEVEESPGVGHGEIRLGAAGLSLGASAASSLFNFFVFLSPVLVLPFVGTFALGLLPFVA